MYRNSKSTALLAAIAGSTLMLPAVVNAQTSVNDLRHTPTSDSQTDHSSKSMRADLTFVKADRLLGSDVKNMQGKTVASVNDMIVNRGTGRIEFVVLQDGGVLGLGGKLVAAPYAMFDFDRTNDRFRVDLTQDDLDQAHDFDKGEWVELNSDSWDEEMVELYRRSTRAVNHAVRDLFGQQIHDADAEVLRGTISSVDRQVFGDGDEYIVVRIDGDRNNSRRIVLGPAWFVMGQDSSPARGDDITVTAYHLSPNSNSNNFVARTATVDGKELVLRGKSGEPRWHDYRANSGSDRIASPYVLLTDLIGMDARLDNDETGEIAGALVETRTGHIAILTLDPDENFLGIGDELKCVPFSIAAVGADSVRIDATEEMLRSCENMPERVSVFASPDRLRPVYSAFNVHAYQFAEPVNGAHKNSWNRDASMPGANAWTSDGAIGEALKEGKETRMTGTVQRLRTLELSESIGTARVLEMRSERNSQMVLLGPAGYINDRDIAVANGDKVTVIGKKIRLNGSTYVVASEIRLENGDRIRLWENGSLASIPR